MVNKELIQLHTNRLLQVATIVGAIVALAGGYTWFKNNFWRPKVSVLNVDYTKGIATLSINGKESTLIGDSSFSAGADWAVRFGANTLDKQTFYDRIELTKYGNVVDYINERKK